MTTEGGPCRQRQDQGRFRKFNQCENGFEEKEKVRGPLVVQVSKEWRSALDWYQWSYKGKDSLILLDGRLNQIGQWAGHGGSPVRLRLKLWVSETKECTQRTLGDTGLPSD